MRSKVKSRGLINASNATPPRRSHRSEKLCAFQVKNATGRTAPRLSRLPSTRQKVALEKFGEAGVKADFPAVVLVCDLALLSLSTALTTEFSSLRIFIFYLFLVAWWGQRFAKSRVKSVKVLNTISHET